jgi:hypothetical protein
MAASLPKRPHQRASGKFGQHDEADRIAMLAAAEAVENVFVNLEGRHFFAVERAAAFRVSSGAVQRDLPADQRGEPGACAQLLKEGGRKRHHATL